MWNYVVPFVYMCPNKIKPQLAHPGYMDYMDSGLWSLAIATFSCLTIWTQVFGQQDTGPQGVNFLMQSIAENFMNLPKPISF